MSCRIKYDIIQTGSRGNATVINNSILIDCGVPFKSIYKYRYDIQLVLLTHIHSDHFNKRTIKNLAKYRPSLRFACGEWLVKPLVDCGVSKKNIDIMKFNKSYQYGFCKITPVPLTHNVPNLGYKVIFKDGRKLIYCTDTNNLNGISAKDFDLYLIEANYEDNEIKERIEQKKYNSQYAYEYQVLNNHLSKAKCDEFIYSNIGQKGQFVYMHQHYNSENENDI